MIMRFFPLNGFLIAAAITGCANGAAKKPATEIKVLPPYRVAYVEYRGDFENNPGIYDVQLDKLLKWAVPEGLWDFPEKTKLIVAYPDDPESTLKGKQRMLMAISVPDDVRIPSKFKEMIIPGGKYAVGRFEIFSDEFGSAWGDMYGKFIPLSGYYPAGGMSFEIKMNDSDLHREKKHIVDICIPVTKK